MPRVNLHQIALDAETNNTDANKWVTEHFESIVANLRKGLLDELVNMIYHQAVFAAKVGKHEFGIKTNVQIQASTTVDSDNLVMINLLSNKLKPYIAELKLDGDDLTTNFQLYPYQKSVKITVYSSVGLLLNDTGNPLNSLFALLIPGTPDSDAQIIIKPEAQFANLSQSLLTELGADQIRTSNDKVFLKF